MLYTTNILVYRHPVRKARSILAIGKINAGIAAQTLRDTQPEEPAPESRVAETVSATTSP